MTSIGLAAGFGCGRLLTPAVGKLLFEVKPTDGASLAIPAACLLAPAALAAIGPALRAVGVNPAVALREE